MAQPAAGHRSIFSGSPLMAPAWELIALGCLVVFYLLAEEVLGRDSIDLCNYMGPVVLMVVLTLGALRMVLLEAASIWLALFWFRVSAGVYYGAGALVPLLTTDSMRLHLDSFFSFTDEFLAKANLVWALGISTVLLTANVYAAFKGRGVAFRERSAGASDGKVMLVVGLMLLGVGSVAKYFFIMPYMFGLLSYTLPGAVGPLAYCSYAAMFLLTAWSLEHSRLSFGLIVGLLLVEMLGGFLMMTKNEVLMPLIMFLLAFIRQRATVTRLGVIGAAISAVFIAIIPVVDYGRNQLWSLYRTTVGVGIGVRLEIIQQGLEGDAWNTASTSDVQAGWVRISYANQSTFAIHLYDSGRPSESLEHLFAVFIPRFLWPEKPNITDIGLDFNFMASGISTSASSPGLFAEAYWIAGWSGVVLLMIPTGFVLAVLSSYALDLMRREQWLYFPVVLLGMRVGLRTDGYFVVDIVGGSVILVATYLIFVGLDQVVRVWFRPSAQRPSRALRSINK